jgi:hypothetical protein
MLHCSISRLMHGSESLFSLQHSIPFRRIFMTDLTLPHRNSRVFSLIAGFGKSISQYMASMRAGLDARDAYVHYNAMSDRELARRGLKREQIPALVMRRYLAGGD